MILRDSVKVIGLWDQGWFEPEVEYRLWRFPLRDFEVDDWYMIPVLPGVPDRVKQVPAIEYILASHQDYEVVAVDEKGQEDLPEFKHPRRAIYVLGRAGRRATDVVPNVRSVRIPTPVNLALLWPHQAISVVLYDRWLKISNCGG